ncbi:MAG: polymer-forming cytoskeletal protein [Chloroflexota bacterium]
MIRKWLILICIIALMPLSVVQARDILADSTCIIDSTVTIQGAVFAFCEELTIDGTINGDLFAATVETRINGTVNGSVYLIGGQVDIDGRVQGDIHFGGAVLRINPNGIASPTTQADNTPLPDSITATSVLRTGAIKSLTLSTTIHPNTQVDGGFVGVGYQLLVEDGVNLSNEINFWGSALTINGRINGNTYAIVGDPASDSSQIETLLLPLNLDLALVNPGLTVGETGAITGLLSYQGPVEGVIDGRMTLEPQYIPPSTVTLTLDEPDFVSLYLSELGSEFSTLMIIGILVVFFGSKLLEAPVANLRNRPFASSAVGMLSFLLSFPVVLIIIVLSLSLLGFLFVLGFRGVVIAIALVLGLVNVGGISIFYFVAIFVTRAVVGLAIGRLILRLVFNRTDVTERLLPYIALAMGVFLLALTSSLPIVGIVVDAVSLFLGLGAIMLVITDQFERIRSVTIPSGNETWYTPSPAIIREHRYPSRIEHATMPKATPPLETAPTEKLPSPNAPNHGTDNLPDGFDWSFFDD